MNRINNLNNCSSLGIIDSLFDLRHKTGKLLLKNKDNGLNNISSSQITNPQSHFLFENH